MANDWSKGMFDCMSTPTTCRLSDPYRPCNLIVVIRKIILVYLPSLKKIAKDTIS